jgi:hypothetical protein
MFYHKYCRGTVVALIKEAVKVGATATIRGGQLAVSGIFLLDGGTEREETNFYCTECNKSISENEVFCMCGRCGEIKSLDLVVTPSDSGGIYCKDCAQRFGEKTEEVKNVIKFIKVQ